MYIVLSILLIFINSIIIAIYFQNKYNRIVKNLLDEQDRLRAMFFKQFQSYSAKEK